ncbi:hypothetical protein JKP88DRAFT_224802, partial [Tribonema minus]
MRSFARAPEAVLLAWLVWGHCVARRRAHAVHARRVQRRGASEAGLETPRTALHSGCETFHRTSISEFLRRSVASCRAAAAATALRVRHPHTIHTLHLDSHGASRYVWPIPVVAYMGALNGNVLCT